MTRLEKEIIDAVDGLRDAICRPGAPTLSPAGGGGRIGDLTEAGISIAHALVKLAQAQEEQAAAMIRIADAHESLVRTLDSHATAVELVAAELRKSRGASEV